MALDPGTHGIVSVEPLPVREEHAAGEWSCSVCGLMHPVRTTWVLTFRPDSGPDLRFILCAGCGKQRIPVFAVIDRDELSSHEGLDDLEEHVDLIVALRSEPEGRYVPIRDADLHRLAQQRGWSTDRFVDELEASGVLRRRGSVPD